MTDTSNKSHQWTGTWTYSKNGINVSENFTGRFDTEEDMLKFRTDSLAKLPNTEAFPNDSGPKATAPEEVVNPSLDFCKMHNTKMKQRNGKNGQTFYSHGQKIQEGVFEYCKGIGWGK